MPPKECFEQAGTAPNTKHNPTVKLIARTDNRLHFIANETVFRIESTASVGLGMKCQLKVEHGNTKLIDKLDFSSAQNRSRFAKLAAGRLRMSGYELEECLNTIADQMDNLLLDDAQAHTRLPKVLTATEETEANKLLKKSELLQVMADALTNSYGIVGEEANRKLCVLITASRLLNKPHGCIIRGNPGSGKSSLIQAASKLLPANDVLYLSRLTPQVLYFLPKECLLNKVMIIDEYEGVADSEYSLRSMMSSQMLSLAISAILTLPW